MSARWPLTLVAGGATLLASAPLSAIFSGWGWLVETGAMVAVVVGVAALLRLARAPGWLPTPAMLVGVVGVEVWRFPSGHEFARAVPTPATLSHWGDLLSRSPVDMLTLTAPVTGYPELLFLASLGTGLVAILVDLFAVILRRPALAGLPMLALYSVPVAVRPESVGVIPFAAGALGFLWLLASDTSGRVRRFGRRLHGDGRDVRRWEPSPLGAAGRWLALLGVLLAVTVPVAVPGLTSGLLDRIDHSGNRSGSGSGNGTVSLDAYLSGELRRDTVTEMLRVRTDEPTPRYLRFGVADELALDGFHGRTPSGGRSAAIGPLAPAAGPGVAPRPFHATVEISNFDMPLLPVYLQPTRIEQLDPAWSYDPTGQLLYSHRGTARNTTYAFDYVPTDFSAAALRTAPPLPDNDPTQLRYTAVPHGSTAANDAARAIASRVGQLTSAAQTPYDQVLAIYDYFRDLRNGFSYSLQTQTGTSGVDIVDFLTTKKGFCQQYSAAMAWLVRAAHIPARVAFGFTRGDSPDGSVYALTNLNLHAWTEVYFAGFGWVAFDPTPSSFITGAASLPWAPDPSPAPGPSHPASARPAPTVPAAAAPTATAGPAAPPGAASKPAGLFPAPLVLTLAGVAGPALLLLICAAPLLTRVRRRSRRRAAATAPGRDRVHAVWDELLDTMVDHRLPPDPAATPRTVALVLVGAAHLVGADADAARQLGQAEERARYARPQPVTDDLDTALMRVTTAIRRQAALRTRIRAGLLPPSVLRRWNSAFGGAADELSRRRARARRLLNLRRGSAGRSSR